MARRTTKSQDDLRRKMAAELCSVETGRAGRSQFTLRELDQRDRPTSLRAAFQVARQWGQSNFFIGGINYLKAAFVNYGLQFKAATPGQEAALQKWLDADEGAQRSTAEKYVASCIDEFLLHDNLVSFWLEAGDFPYPLRCEECRYTEALGHPLLRVEMRHDPADLKGAGLSPEQVKRYTRGEVTLDERYGEYYEVLTRAPRGRGFGLPRMRQVFLACSEAESMEVGESMVAYAARSVIRMHRLGWEVKRDSGLRQSDAMWDQERSDGIEEEFQDGNMIGVKNATANFDHKIEHIWALADIKLDGKKWESVTERLKWYGGPLAFMLLARTLNPDLLPMFAAEVQRLRQDLKLHLQRVLNRSLTPPGGLRLQWGNRCFTTPKLFWDMTKTLMEQGPLPLRDALQAADVDPDTAAQQKLAEADDPQKEKKYLPLHEKFQGRKTPGDPGRKPGVRDGEGQPA